MALKKLIEIEATRHHSTTTIQVAADSIGEAIDTFFEAQPLGHTYSAKIVGSVLVEDSLPGDAVDHGWSRAVPSFVRVTDEKIETMTAKVVSILSISHAHAKTAVELVIAELSGEGPRP